MTEADHDAARAIIDDIEPELKAADHPVTPRNLDEGTCKNSSPRRAGQHELTRSSVTAAAKAEVSTLISENTLARLEREIRRAQDGADAGQAL
jgi:hypothetical protein